MKLVKESLSVEDQEKLPESFDKNESIDDMSLTLSRVLNRPVRAQVENNQVHILEFIKD